MQIWSDSAISESEFTFSKICVHIWWINLRKTFRNSVHRTQADQFSTTFCKWHICLFASLLGAFFHIDFFSERSNSKYCDLIFLLNHATSFFFIRAISVVNIWPKAFLHFLWLTSCAISFNRLMSVASINDIWLLVK